MCPLHLDDHPAATVTRPWFQLGTLSLAPDQHALMVSTCFSPRHMHVQGDSSHLFETTAIITLATRSRDITYVTRSLLRFFLGHIQHTYEYKDLNFYSTTVLSRNFNLQVNSGSKP